MWLFTRGILSLFMSPCRGLFIYECRRGQQIPGAGLTDGSHLLWMLRWNSGHFAARSSKCACNPRATSMVPMLNPKRILQIVEDDLELLNLLSPPANAGDLCHPLCLSLCLFFSCTYSVCVQVQSLCAAEIRELLFSSPTMVLGIKTKYRTC